MSTKHPFTVSEIWVSVRRHRYVVAYPPCLGLLANQPTITPIIKVPRSSKDLDMEIVQTRNLVSTTWVF